MSHPEKTSKSALESGPRATRMAPPDDIKINARTLGTRLSFDIHVANVSRSGLLLEWKNQKHSLPFIENTLIEIEVTAQLKGEQRRVSCMGKVVRKINSEANAQYGVRMIHNEDHDHIEWLTIVTMFEKTLPHL
ncbi:MAG: PilZ domain-containing protein [Pseudomonadota bacterium]